MLSFNIPTFVWVAINLFVLYTILKKILFKPVTEFMENRTNLIKDDMDRAQRDKTEAAQMKQDYEDRLRSAKIEANKILDEARSRANKEYEEILNFARKDAQGILDKASEEIQHEREQMIKDVRNQVATLALAAASKVLEANMDTESNRILVERFVEDTGVA